MVHKRSSEKNKIAGARGVALEVLIRVDRDRAYSNLLLNEWIERSGLQRTDAALATELVYGTLQRRNTLDYILEGLVSKGIGKLELWVLNLLRMSVYQLKYLDRIPPHAAVNEAVNLAKERGHRGITGMVNGVLRSVIRCKELPVFPNDMPREQRLALEYSHPQWMVAKWIRQFGEEATEAICQADNRSPHVSIRVNRVKTSREEMLEALQREGYEAKPSPLAADGIVVESGGNMAHTDWYKQGEISIQDESSMFVAAMTMSEPGMQVLDCCAAPGGKAAHLAELMHDQGTVWANDIHEHKVRLVEKQAGRLGLSSIRTSVGDAAKLSQTLKGKQFDRILLDAPCSGLGVIRRKPEIKWTKDERDIEAISEIQAALLHEVQQLLKPGGILVYSTCTLASEENEEMIANFLAAHPDFAADMSVNEQLEQRHLQKLETGPGMLTILPFHFDSDGFFIARMRKKHSG